MRDKCTRFKTMASPRRPGGMVELWIQNSPIHSQVNSLYLQNAYAVILKSLVHRGLFWAVAYLVMSFFCCCFLFICSFYNTMPFFLPNLIWFLLSLCFLVFFCLCVCMCLVILGFVFLSCWIFSYVFLSSQSSWSSTMVNQKMVFNPSKAQSLRPA